MQVPCKNKVKEILANTATVLLACVVLSCIAALVIQPVMGINTVNYSQVSSVLTSVSMSFRSITVVYSAFMLIFVLVNVRKHSESILNNLIHAALVFVVGQTTMHFVT